ncbi:hypothetical protein H4R19_000961 [Coemansia spiralis]|nr:hypothetical protein H4R19_000961 [Coemansia spiralis]
MDPTGQNQPAREGSFSPTNPFSGMAAQHHQQGTYPPPDMAVARGTPNDQADMTTRLANLQLSAAGSQPPAQASMAQQQQPFGAGYAGGYPPTSSVPLATSAPLRSGSYAPGYGPAPPPPPPAAQLHSSPTLPRQQPLQQPPPPMDMRPPPPPVQAVHHLPAIVGPMLQFVSVELERALWHGSVLVMTNESLLPNAARNASGASPGQGGAPSAHVPTVEVWDDGVHGPGTGKPKTFVAKALYTEPTYRYTFWRADISLVLPQESEVDVLYQVYWSADEHAVQSPSARRTHSFRLPAQASRWRMCVTSNNQFAPRVPEAARAALRGSGPVFRDLLAKHKTNPFHVWIGTGGQFNGESVWDDCEHVLRPFLIPALDNVRRSHVVWTAEMAAAVERWYLLEYMRQWFGIGASSAMETDGQACFRQAVETLPYSFTPDSEIFSGYGSYSPTLQSSPVFSGIKGIGAKYYALFQAHTTPELAHTEHGFLAEGYHSLKQLGPYTALLTLDTRTERHLAGIVDRGSYDTLFAELDSRVPATTTNLITVASNPVIFPRTKNFESLLRSASNSGITSIISYAVNGGSSRQARNDWISKDRFGEAMAVTKLNDFWTCAAHRSERSFLVHSLQDFARRRSCRVTFVSGHVNCLSAAHFRTIQDGKFDARRFPEQRGFVSDFRSMIQLTVSGMVQEPADGLTLRAFHFAGKTAPFDAYTEEKMYHTFNMDVNQLPPPNNNQKLLGRRSYGIIIEHEFDNDRQRPGLMSFFYVEDETCTGTANPYIINIPPLRYPILPAPHQQQQQQIPPMGAAAPPPDRPQLRPGVTYRSYTAAVQTPGVAGAADSDSREESVPANDPYSYDAPGYEGQPAAAVGAMGGSSGGSGSPMVNPPPPPYTMQSRAATAVLPARTEGTYSSSYEHTAAWVQGNGPHSAASDADSGASHHHQAQHYAQPLSPHQQPQYLPHSAEGAQYVSQAPVQYVSQAPVQYVSQAPVQYVSQPPPTQ